MPAYPRSVVTTDPVLVLPSLSADLDRVEERLQAEVRCDLDFLSTVARHLIGAGGKRIRPGLTIAAAGIADPEGRSCSDDVVAGAVAVELVHMGSLYHDDVIDGATTRRNVASVNATWGNATAILAGDFLLARASQLAANLGTEVAGLLAATIGRLCEGQIREYQDAFNCDRTVHDYELSITGKTASLLAASCRVGAIVAGLPPVLTEALADFGHSYGMAFQIVDDILDVISTEDMLGKPAGHDLREGNYTLPVLLTVQSPAGERLRSILGPGLSPADAALARRIIRSGSGIMEAYAAASVWADRAASALTDLPDTPAAEALRAAADHLLGRVGSSEISDRSGAVAD
ncbi:MAG: polyprenyl synthetase family protein [Acidimicrobiia bacterium]|nr:polyprenyl synthetase family protein [Acidimicrobiia bacterium]